MADTFRGAGDLRTPLEVLELVADGDPDRNGAVDRTATVVDRLWGRIEATGGSEGLEAGRTQTATTLLGVVRKGNYPITPTNQLRIRGTSRVFEIVSAVDGDDGRGRIVRLELVEQGP